MNNEIRVLILEDTPADAELAERELRRAGVVFTSKRVDTKDAFARELEDFKPDIILADYKLPAFDGRSAVQLVRQTHPEVPVIMVTGTLGDEAAVELLKAGARDYVLKDGLARLGPAVRRALSEEQGIRARKQAERAVKDSERRFRSLIEHASDLVTVVDAQGKITYISPAVKRLGGYKVDEVLGTLYLDYTHPGDRHTATAGLAELLRDPGKLHVSEYRFRAKDGAWVTLESIARNALDDPPINGIVINSRDITERRLAQSELEFKNSVLSTQQETSLDAMLLVDENRKILSYNRRFVDLWGLPEDMLKAGLNEPILKSVVSQTEDPDAYLARVLYLYEHPEEKSREEIRLKDGRTIDRYSASVIGAGGKCFGRVWYYRDITERKHAEEKIARLNRLYATLSGINTAIVHAASQVELFDLICQVAVEHGRFSMAWIGTVDRADQMVTPVAHRGLTPEDMVVIRDSIGRVEAGRGRTATSIRESRPIYTNDYDAERSLTPWHAEAVKQGVRGSATLPITQRGEIVGVLKLYVREQDFFDAEQLALLEEMGTDISFALDHFDTETKRTQAEAALLESEVRLKAIFDAAADGILLAETETRRFRAANASICRMLGYSQEEMLDLDMSGIHPEEALPHVNRQFELQANGQIGIATDLPVKRKDGSVFFADVNSTPVTLGGKACLLGIFRDVTERKLAEADHRQYADKLGRSLEQTIRAVAATVEMRDPYTAGHQRRVADLAVAIARELGLPEEQILGLHLAGIVHDLGKIQVPAEILSKPGKLTDIEFSLIKIHPQAGYDILKDVEFPWPIAQIVLQHHERLDGRGYPQGLKAEQILLESKILAVADVVEAMSSHRPYRPGLGIEKALSEIERGRGIAYEPAVADACVKLFREKQFSWT